MGPDSRNGGYIFPFFKMDFIHTGSIWKPGICATFLAVVDQGSVSRAADWLGIAQPALSQTLARMEKDLGVQLFQRSRQGALPTPAALAMLDDVRTSVARIDAAASRAREIARGSAGQLTVGLVSSALFGTLPRALRALRQQAPGVRVILREMSNAEQAEALQTGAIDIGLMHTPVAVGGRMRERQLLRERLVAAVPDEFQIGEDGQVSLAQIAEAGLVMYPQGAIARAACRHPRRAAQGRARGPCGAGSQPHPHRAGLRGRRLRRGPSAQLDTLHGLSRRALLRGA